MNSTEKKEKPMKKKPMTKRKIGKRTVIGIICILVAMIMCFVLGPFLTKVSEHEVVAVRIKQPVEKWSVITEDDLELVNVKIDMLPASAIKSKSEAVGKYAAAELYPGELLLSQKVSPNMEDTEDILESLGDDQKAISVSIGSFALGLSGKLQTGDIVSVIVYRSKEENAFTPDELQYLKVITTTTSSGVDKEDVTDNTQPATVTLLVTKEQAELLAFYEKSASIHFTLECRGDSERAQEYLDQQKQYLSKGEEAT